MKAWTRRKVVAVWCGGAGLVLASVAGVVVAHEGVGDTGQVHACVAKKGGRVRFVGADATLKCKKSETALHFNIAGANGANGANGASGATGATGATGSSGAAGRSALTALQSGETVYGQIGFQAEASAGGVEFGATASLPIPSSVGLDDAHVSVNGEDDGGECTGASTNPTAAAGYVCIYPYSTSNVQAGSPTGYVWGAGDGTKWGFQLSWRSNAGGVSYYMANWAYTAP